MNAHTHTMYQNLWDAAKAVRRGKRIAINPYTEKEERSQINNLNFNLRKLKKVDQTKCEATRKKEKTWMERKEGRDTQRKPTISKVGSLKTSTNR